MWTKEVFISMSLSGCLLVVSLAIGICGIASMSVEYNDEYQHGNKAAQYDVPCDVSWEWVKAWFFIVYLVSFLLGACSAVMQIHNMADPSMTD
mmetsp:Transcript_99052/g.175531  ORF Transcript_99052/g.175531 Transcript_99052/m.175531 type:complete len:93 (-) Transcript_99052:175-453(-)